ncbi:TerD domain [Seminavis robusta]|uniref:TerD domain n=1 Tax=Seminavis robusta TaxID=568900 RepID=A0A9N8F603_9STRA|nr:TerD domain [Seminavis robusta]|eukprot:Sro3793_g351090.1 TerD domain (467) ;mRNA; r:1605-3005
MNRIELDNRSNPYSRSNALRVSDHMPTMPEDAVSAPMTTAPAIKYMELKLCVLKGDGLAAKDRNFLLQKTSSDPYCICELHAAGNKPRKLFQTRTVAKTLSPVWNEQYVLDKPLPAAVLQDKNHRPTIVLRLFDYDIGRKDDSMGVVTIPIQAEDINISQWYEVPAHSAKGAKGRIKVAIKTKVHYENEESIIVLKGAAKRRNTTPGAYLDCLFFGGNCSDHNQPRNSLHKNSGHRRNSHNEEVSRLNIFGSEMITKDFILTQLDQLESNQDIVLLELEDCFVSQRRNDDDSMEIPLRIKEILAQDLRPWREIRFVDELHDAWSYLEFRRRRKQFLSTLDGICKQKVIPVTFKTTIHLSEYDRQQQRRRSAKSITSLIRHFQKDPSVVKVHIDTNQTTVEMIDALTDLLKCDDRYWADLTLKLQTDNPPQSPEWRSAMEEASNRLQAAIRASGMDLPDKEDEGVIE